MANPLDPNRMSPAERLAELGRILAAGVMRLKSGKSTDLCNVTGDSLVDFEPRKSGSRRASRIRIGDQHED